MYRSSVRNFYLLILRWVIESPTLFFDMPYMAVKSRTDVGIGFCIESLRRQVVEKMKEEVVACKKL